MARYRHWQNGGLGGHCSFVTTSALNFAPVFAEPHNANTMLRILAEQHLSLGARLHGYCVMPDHVHFLTGFPIDLSTSALVQRIKSLSAREILPSVGVAARKRLDVQAGLGRRTFWQRSFRGKLIDCESAYLQVLGYMHRNPVKRGLCANACDYPFSSAAIWAKDSGSYEGLDLRQILSGL
jgi:putative transposase